MLPLLLAFSGALLAQTGDGKNLYQGHCAPCHGVTAAGGRGPSLVQPNLKNGSSDDAMFAVIRDGVAGTEMPRAWQMTEREIRLVIAYVRSVSAASNTPLPGDASRGAAIYRSQGCAACHITRGEGIAVGPDLTLIGSSRSPDYLRRALLDPGAEVPERYAIFQVTPLAGAPLRAARINEDVFTIQLRTAPGRYRSFRKSQFKSMEKIDGASEMPSYRDKLTAAQLDDIVAYLAGLRGNP